MDKEKFLPKFKILLSRRRLKKKKDPGDRKSWSSQLSGAENEAEEGKTSFFFTAGAPFTGVVGVPQWGFQTA